MLFFGGFCQYLRLNVAACWHFLGLCIPESQRIVWLTGYDASPCQNTPPLAKWRLGQVIPSSCG